MLDRNVKINDRLEFDEKIDLSKYLSKAERAKYILHSILIHSGTPTHGHYFGYINTGGSWLRFNDEVVDRVTKKQVLKSSYGGFVSYFEVQETGLLQKKKYKNDTSAYMLIYIRKELHAEITR